MAISNTEAAAEAAAGAGAADSQRREANRGGSAGMATHAKAGAARSFFNIHPAIHPQG